MDIKATTYIHIPKNYFVTISQRFYLHTGVLVYASLNNQAAIYIFNLIAVSYNSPYHLRSNRKQTCTCTAKH